MLAALPGMEREYIRDRTLKGHESARTRGKRNGGAAVTDKAMLSHALYLREQGMTLRAIAGHLVITRGKKKGRHPSPATVMRMFREHDADGQGDGQDDGQEDGRLELDAVLAALPVDSRPAPSVTQYDQLMRLPRSR